jgi:hypothetical protein
VAPFVVVAVVVVGAGFGLWLLAMRYAVERTRITRPRGPAYDILVHRDGVTLFTGDEAFLTGSDVIFPTFVALFRRWRRGPWEWAVTVRQSPFMGHIDLLHEVYPDEAAARDRAYELATLVARGERLWSIAAEQ